MCFQHWHNVCGPLWGIVSHLFAILQYGLWYVFSFLIFSEKIESHLIKCIYQMVSFSQKVVQLLMSCHEFSIFRRGYLKLDIKEACLSCLVLHSGPLLYLEIPLESYSRICYWKQMKIFCNVLREFGVSLFRYMRFGFVQGLKKVYFIWFHILSAFVMER